jgi:D-glycero-alpha-D-manno-heptose-7-phosphate kinase
MLITRTPLRISFAGGGTDFPAFYEKEGGGVISTSIDKYIYVILNRTFDGRVIVNYSKREICSTAHEVKHDLVREAMRKAGVLDGVEITTMADIPSEGTGLGSSSSLTVGLLHALYTYAGKAFTREQLAEDACDIEINILGRPIGKQDQYISSLGGLRLFNFHKNGSVTTELVRTNPMKRSLISRELMLFYTGITRQSSEILKEQQLLIPQTKDILCQIRDQVMPMKAYLIEGPRSGVGSMLDAGWKLKKRLAGTISTSKIDGLYKKAVQAGATGGKISGAGGGGFLLLHCLPQHQDAVRRALKLVEMPFELEEQGTSIVLNDAAPKVIPPKVGYWYDEVFVK